jgi:Flp pilus assembly protein TadG
MRPFVSLLERFRSDERGAFLVIFGVLAIVLVATSGAVVDYTAIEQARTRAQVALDTAALGLQPDIYDTPAPTAAQLTTKAGNLLVQQLGTGSDSWSVCTDQAIPPCAQIDELTFDKAEGTLRIEASIKVPTYFVSLIGFPNVTARLMSEATRKQLDLEVVMVLDQSGSMNQSNRMMNLVAAAKCAVNVLFNSGCNDNAATASNDNISMGLVPFTMQVNVGTGNANASWMDKAGVSDIANDNFDSDDNESTAYAGPIDRIALFDQFSNVSWGGCVEARKSPYDTDDTVPTSANSDTLFVPLFAPDEPPGFINDYIASDSPSACNSTSGICTWTEIKTDCRSYNNCTGGTTNVYALVPNPSSTSCTCPGPTYLTDATTYIGTGSSRTYTRIRTCNPYTPTGLSDRELQERICKYTSSTPTGISQVSAKGPNGDCPANPITPLTTTKSTVISAINNMASQGGTNIHAGTIWGFHVLSPTEPFTQAKEYDAATSKVMIVMTDGENTAYKSSNMNGSSYYSYYGYPWNQRMGTTSWTDAQLETEMDTRLVTTCTNAKAAGIVVYTIGLATSETSNQTKVETMLKNCSSGTGYYYFPAAASELEGVFEEIASQLANLRLAR